MNSHTPQPLRAVAIREIRLAKPSKVNLERANAALSSLSRVSSDTDELQKQADLLHVEAVLVTEGINANDDAFMREELKRAISSPILKPMNWQHNDAEILGAMYAVEARDLEGNKLAAEEIGDTPVELVIQGVVWHHLPHIKTTAKEIVQRIDKGDLFVSMECWFNSYDYALFTSAGELWDVISRDSDTAFLDGYLRSRGGTGIYNGKRIGRALAGINFGGVAFVDRPANDRSLILEHFAFDPTALAEEVVASTDGLEQTQVVTNNVVSNDEPLEVNMNDLNRAAASANADEIRGAVEGALEAREAAAKATASAQELTQTKARNAELEKQVADAKAALEVLQATVETAYAGATADTPAEIAQIDAAIDSKGDVFAAKLAWINATRSKAFELATTEKSDAKADEKLIEENTMLKAELTAVKNEMRQADIEYLFGTVLKMSADEVKTFVETGLAQASDEEYSKWLDEKKVFARKILDMVQGSDTEAGLLEPMQREVSIDDKGATLRPELGSAPSDLNRTPRSKVSASLEDLFEAVSEPNLAGAEGAERTSASPMQGLVGGLLAKKEGK